MGTLGDENHLSPPGVFLAVTLKAVRGTYSLQRQKYSEAGSGYYRNCKLATAQAGIQALLMTSYRNLSSFTVPR
jgi:hypothetical protein